MKFNDLEHNHNLLPPYCSIGLYSAPIDTEFFKWIKQHVLNIIDTYGTVPTSDERYKTMALTFNPNISPWWNQYSKELHLGDNGRDDTYRFSIYTPHGLFINRISKTNVVKAKITSTQGYTSEWHVDESINEAIKCIIPISYNKDYYFQMDNHSLVALEEGYLYCFDASQYHRFVSKIYIASSDIIHLVFSNPTKYRISGSGWTKNEIYDESVNIGDYLDQYFHIL